MVCPICVVLEDHEIIQVVSKCVSQITTYLDSGLIHYVSNVRWTEELVMCIQFCLVLHRYLGEEEDGSVSKESRSQALLAKLQQKAKEKQEQSLTEQRQQTVQKPEKKSRKADKDNSQEPQRHKKRKSEEDLVDVLGSDNKDETVKEKRKKKSANEKQKKKHQSGLFFFSILIANSGVVWAHTTES